MLMVLWMQKIEGTSLFFKMTKHNKSVNLMKTKSFKYKRNKIK